MEVIDKKRKRKEEMDEEKMDEKKRVEEKKEKKRGKRMIWPGITHLSISKRKASFVAKYLRHIRKI